MVKTFIITGASGGIGVEITKKLLKEGHRVIGTFLSNPKVLKKIRNPKLSFFQLDSKSEESIEEFKKNIKHIKINGLVNNAGMNIPGSFGTINQKLWKEVHDVNLLGPYMITQKLEKNFLKDSSIINIASFSGQIGGPISTHYATAKSGLISLTHNMAVHFAKKKIRVNCISPGLINTKMAKNAKKHPMFSRIILNRVGEPHEIASVVSFLLSDNSTYITGQTINVNGGMFF